MYDNRQTTLYAKIRSEPREKRIQRSTIASGTRSVQSEIFRKKY